MIASWMVYILTVSAAITIAAALVERALRGTGTPARFLWVAGICFPVAAATASAWLRDPAHARQPVILTDDLSSRDTGQDQHPLFRTLVPTPLSITVPPDSRLAMLDSTLLALWLAGCLLTLSAFAGGAVRLRRIRTAGKIFEIDGVSVCVTPSTGPLAAGLLHPQILLPKWALELEQSERQLVVAHEQAHLRTRDPALLAFSAFVVGLIPWSPFAWYMLRRLGQAIELDCDRRVLAERPDLEAYARLLLSVASRRQSTLIPLAGLAGATSFLEERFRSMTTESTTNRGYRLVSAIAVVTLVLVTTAILPRPVRGAQRSANQLLAQSGGRATGRIKVVSASGASTYKIYATGGSFSSGRESLRARTDTVTKSVLGLTSAGDVFEVDVTNGDVHFVTTDASSIHVEAAMSGTSPALWLSATGRHIVIQRGGAGIHGPTDAQPADSATSAFFEFQVDQSVVLRGSVKPAYPAALKSSGISGDVWAEFVVDETGHVDMQTFKSLNSPDPQLTAAAKAVLPQWRFDPAIRQGKRVRQVVQQAFEFTPDS